MWEFEKYRQNIPKTAEKHVGIAKPCGNWITSEIASNAALQVPELPYTYMWEKWETL